PPEPRRTCPGSILRLTRARSFLDVDQSMPSPSHAREPRLCPRNRRRPFRIRNGSPPSLEPPRRRARVHSFHTTNVFLHVGEDVHERVADLSRCREHPRVVAIAPYGASSAERAIAGLRCA